MSKGLSIKIYAHPTRTKGDRSQLFVRMIYDRKKAEFATKYYASAKQWDPDKERYKKDAIMNTELVSIESELRKIVQRLTYEEKSISAKSIKDIYLGKDSLDVMLLERYQIYLKYITEGSLVAQQSLRTYNKTYNNVCNFIKTTYGSDINVRRVDLSMIEAYDEFLSHQKNPQGEPLKHNTIHKHHSRFRTYLHYLRKHELIASNPYDHFRVKFIESERTFLTQEELDAFSTCSLGGNKSLEKVRDYFLFSVYTGMRFSDAQKLQMKNISIEKGQWYFTHVEQKTHKHSKLPLLKPAIEIVEKYANTPERSFGFVLPKHSNQKVNTKLKIIADLANIQDKVVSHHVARHTCATTILLENGITLDKVQVWLNHANIRETMVYAKMTKRAINGSRGVRELIESYNVRPSAAI